MNPMRFLFAVVLVHLHLLVGVLATLFIILPFLRIQEQSPWERFQTPFVSAMKLLNISPLRILSSTSVNYILVQDPWEGRFV